MFDIFFQLDLFRQIILISVYDHTDIAAFFRLFKHFHMLALASSDNRCQQQDLGTLRQFHNVIHHLVYRLFLDLLAALWAMRDTHSGKQQSEIIIHFCDGSYRRPRISVRRFLVNGYSRRQSFQTFHIRFFHLSQKLPGIRGQRFHITPLSFCINGIKGKRRLA